MISVEALRFSGDVKYLPGYDIYISHDSFLEYKISVQASIRNFPSFSLLTNTVFATSIFHKRVRRMRMNSCGIK